MDAYISFTLRLVVCFFYRVFDFSRLCLIYIDSDIVNEKDFDLQALCMTVLAVVTVA